VPAVDVVLSSPYPRAWRTAEILAEEAGWPAPEACRALEADRASSDAVRELPSHGRRSSLALVGHEPNLSELASLLLTGNESGATIEMKKGGVACLGLAEGQPVGRCVLRWVATPKMLRAMAEGIGAA